MSPLGSFANLCTFPGSACVCPCFVNPRTPMACGGLKAEFERLWYMLSKGLSEAVHGVCCPATPQHGHALGGAALLHDPPRADQCPCARLVGAKQLGHEQVYFGLQGKGLCSGAAAPISVCDTVSKMSVPVAGPAQLTLALHLHAHAASFTLIFLSCFFNHKNFYPGFELSCSADGGSSPATPH